MKIYTCEKCGNLIEVCDEDDAVICECGHCTDFTNPYMKYDDKD